MKQTQSRRIEPEPHDSCSRAYCKAVRVRTWLVCACLALIQLGVTMVTGCGGEAITSVSRPTAILISLSGNSSEGAGTKISAIDTNCTGCNSVDILGRPVNQFTARFAGGGVARVLWSVAEGDPIAGPGSISADGQYAPPSYLSRDHASVVVTASLEANRNVMAKRTILVTPGFLRPLTPENAAIGANGRVTVTGYLAEAGGSTGIEYSVASAPDGTGREFGSLSETSCKRRDDAFTSCAVTYYAPPSIANREVAYVVASVGSSPARIVTRILLNTEGVSSDPATHQLPMASPIQLGSSGGNNGDFDVSQGRVADCCGGTLGALLKDSDNREYLLSNNHVFAGSDHASVGDPIIQPGLIDNNCTPNSPDSSPAPVAALTDWLPLESRITNVDAAIAEIRSSAFDPAGSILEMGPKQGSGALAAAPLGITSSGGKGESGTLHLKVAKSGRTTGLTCAAITAVDADVKVDYYADCAETKPYLNKLFTGQLVISGDGFGDAGDSGSLIVDANNAEPVGLYFAGGIDASGVSHAIANPAPDVLRELNARNGAGITYSYVGAKDHPVNCLDYGDSTVETAQALPLSGAELQRAQEAVVEAQVLVNPAAGILSVAAGRSNDRSGEAAVVVFVDESVGTKVPSSIGGVRTVAMSGNGNALGSAVNSLASPVTASTTMPTTLNAAIAVKRQYAAMLMQLNPAFFAIGVGQSLDNPGEAALIIYAERRLLPLQLPQSIGGLRTRYIVMDRFHVTRSYAQPAYAGPYCHPGRAAQGPRLLESSSVAGSRN